MALSAHQTGAKVQPSMNKPRDSRFTPGAGISPPVLAGREKEKNRIASALDNLEAGLKTTENIALIGPRGNGKTVLLRWAQAQVRERYDKIECAVLNQKSFESYQDLVGALADPGILSALADEGFSAGMNMLGSGISYSRPEAAKRLLGPVLEKRCSENGLAILIDEAHTLDRYADSARAFLNDAQALAGDGRPLLLILAGTPDISARLNKIEAAFWDRSRRIGIGPLDDAAAREALRVPLERMGYGIEADTLDKAVNEAQCYPYFLQVVGDALHEAAVEKPGKLGSGNEIGDAILKQALKEFKVATNNYYDRRYRELRRAGVLPVAEAVARRFVSQQTESISAGAFEAVVSRSIDAGLKMLAKERGGIDPAAWFEDQLRDFGLVWSSIGHEASCEAGIPSLMSYIVERADEREGALRQI